LPAPELASVAEVKALVARMTDNGLTASPEEFGQIVFYLSANLTPPTSASSR
jgi:hypothetical protein